MFRVCLLYPKVTTLFGNRFSLEIEELINEEQELTKLLIAARVLTEQYVNPDAILKVFQRVWTKKRGIELKAMDQTTFIFYFEEMKDLLLSLHRAPWNFNNALVVVKKVEPSICPSQLAFNSLPFWIQIHDMPPNWRKLAIILKLVGKVGEVLELDQS